MPIFQDTTLAEYGPSRDGYAQANGQLEGKLRLTNAQIKALGTYNLLPSPGPGKMIIFRSGLVIARLTAGYTNIGATTATMNFELGSTVVGITHANAAAFSAMMGSAGLRNKPVAAVGGLLNNGDIDDTPLEFVLANDLGALTGGNAANSLEIQFWYSLARI